MISIIEKWALPDADGDHESAWSAVIRALLGKWGRERCALIDDGVRVGSVTFHGFGAVATAFVKLPHAGSFDVALPAGGKHTGGVVKSHGAVGSWSAGTAYPFAAGTKTVTINGPDGDVFEIVVWFTED